MFKYSLETLFPVKFLHEKKRLKRLIRLSESEIFILIRNIGTSGFCSEI